jgi:hypothetical protein
MASVVGSDRKVPIADHMARWGRGFTGVPGETSARKPVNIFGAPKDDAATWTEQRGLSHV